MTARSTMWTAAAGLAGLAIAAAPAVAQRYGPIDVDLPAGGDSYSRAIGGATGTPFAAPAWTLSTWIEPQRLPTGTTLIGGFGDPASGPRRYLALVAGRPALMTEAGTLTAATRLPATGWHHIAATLADGVARLYVDGRAVAQGQLAAAPVLPTATLGPRGAGPAFAGRLIDFAMTAGAQDAAQIRADATHRPDPAAHSFQTGSPHWPVQTRQMYGQVAPQDAWTLPRSRAPIPAAIAKPLGARPELSAAGTDRWTIGAWQLAEAPRVADAGDAISHPGYTPRGWYAATVPGTVLTTLVDRGVYPDPAYGLNNTVIPESLARQDYWYRSAFDAPAAIAGKRQTLTFDGVNYAAEVWLNGARLGTMKGAFIRGRFDVTGKLVPGRNAIAVRVSPPPHPGLNHEESMTAGVGENGGMMMLDGPTFVATEGWDWIPSVRDRNTGLWRGVTLGATGPVELGDAQVVTALPRADNTVAEIEITVPVRNHDTRPQTVAVRAAFDDVTVETPITLAAGEARAVLLRPADFPQLRIRNPKLWWPNGYGDPALHDLTLSATAGGTPSDQRRLRFGMRTVTYDLSLMDDAGALERVNVNLTTARAHGERIVDGSHTGIRKVAGGWAASLYPGAQRSAAVTPVKDAPGLSPYLVLRVNGVKIAARGGNIGMDDFMKRVDRPRLEPYFRLHRDAHLNIVRNWVGQDTEDTFFDLADEYGLMVLSDFWESTQDYNIETQDPDTFMANAEDVVKRFRNHPSIVAWFGRNEGVPQPLLNERLQGLIAHEDGTRLYMGSSNRVNLQDSGPYNWQPPATYFTTHARGFSVEDGTPSLPTLEAWQKAIAPADQWPIGDAWAYHDWHQTGNGAVKTYMDALETRFGAGTSLPDFERKAQMMQYESYRAIFEGMNAGLWTVNSGRMLWMTQPAWPSSAWNIFSSDYDTQASFYGVKAASEPVHVQMNLPDGKVVLVNNRLADLPGVRVTATAVDLAGRTLAMREAVMTGRHEAASDAFTLDLPALTAGGVAVIRLVARDAAGVELSHNVYWQAKDDAGYRGLTTMAPAGVTAQVARRTEGDEAVATVTLVNPASVPALEVKLTLRGSDGGALLPAYYSDNYVSLLPGETRRVEVRYPAKLGMAAPVTIRGWNVANTTARVQ